MVVDMLVLVAAAGAVGALDWFFFGPKQGIAATIRGAVQEATRHSGEPRLRLRVQRPGIPIAAGPPYLFTGLLLSPMIAAPRWS